jgi:hypothetical protein
VRFLLDEMYPPVAAEQLRRRGVDAVAVKESPAFTGLEGDILLALAESDRRVLVTENIADFAVLGRVAGFARFLRTTRSWGSTDAMVAPSAGTTVMPDLLGPATPHISVMCVRGARLLVLEGAPIRKSGALLRVASRESAENLTMTQRVKFAWRPPRFRDDAGESRG